MDNRPGASGNIATEEVVAHARRLYAASCAATNAWNVTLYDNLNFDFTRDIAPVASYGRDGCVMVVNPSFPAKTVPEFIAYAKANPGKINMATAGPGSGSDIMASCSKRWRASTCSQCTIAAFGLALPDLWPAGFRSYSSLSLRRSVHQSRQAAAARSDDTTRREVLPDVPAMGDFVPGYEATNWRESVRREYTAGNHRDPQQRS